MFLPSERNDAESDVRQQTRSIIAFLLTVAVVTGLSLAIGSPIWAAPDVAAIYLICSAPLAIAVASSTRRRYGSVTLAALTLGMLCAVMVPNVYVAARSRHELMAIDDLLDQSRLGEARTKVDELLRLAPSTSWRNRPLQDLVRQLDWSVHDLERQVAIPLAHPTSEERLDRCRKLAMLGRTDEAFSELVPLLQSGRSPTALDLAGTMHEANSDWELGRLFHQRAKEMWQIQSASPDRTNGLLRATTRVAYCERKLGHYERAEQGYLEAVTQSPTAENHFLIAQFYEDMQQSAKARTHARTAMALAPQQYTEPGQKLLNKLMVGHFGCLDVFRAESGTHRAGQSDVNAPSF